MRGRCCTAGRRCIGGAADLHPGAPVACRWGGCGLGLAAAFLQSAAELGEEVQITELVQAPAGGGWGVGDGGEFGGEGAFEYFGGAGVVAGVAGFDPADGAGADAGEFGEFSSADPAEVAGSAQQLSAAELLSWFGACHGPRV